MNKYAKAVAAAIAGVVTLAATLGLDVTWATDQFIQGAGVVITTIAVWFVPNGK